MMEKYGVALDDEMTKQASETSDDRCPWCKEVLDSGRACPTHGTKPFEKRAHGSEEEGSD
jgi:hypothetical protein